MSCSSLFQMHDCRTGAEALATARSSASRTSGKSLEEPTGSVHCPERMLVLVHVSAAGHRLLRERLSGSETMSEVTAMSVSGQHMCRRSIVPGREPD